MLRQFMVKLLAVIEEQFFGHFHHEEHACIVQILKMNIIQQKNSIKRKLHQY